MVFEAYIQTDRENEIPVSIQKMQKTDAVETRMNPVWQTDWTSAYITDSDYESYAVRTVEGELIALGMYETLEKALVVRIVYMESQPESNPTIVGKKRKYHGIGKLMVAYGIKLSIDNGFGGDVILEAKTDALAVHYQRDFGGIALPTFDGGCSEISDSGRSSKTHLF